MYKGMFKRKRETAASSASSSGFGETIAFVNFGPWISTCQWYFQKLPPVQREPSFFVYCVAMVSDTLFEK
jgi:hypothetical protein